MIILSTFHFILYKLMYTSFPTAYHSWSNGIMETYKIELTRLLWPFFYGCFFKLIEKNEVDMAKQLLKDFRKDHENLYLEDILKLDMITSQAQFLESSFYKERVTPPENKWIKLVVYISKFAYGTLMQYTYRVDPSKGEAPSKVTSGYQLQTLIVEFVTLMFTPEEYTNTLNYNRDKLACHNAPKMERIIWRAYQRVCNLF
jgi:hypothetical protein